MPSQGPLGPGTGADDATAGNKVWTNPGNITAEDGVFAACTSIILPVISHYLKATNFGFSIPAGATINGILVEWKTQNSGGTFTDNSIKIVQGGTISGNENANGTNWPRTLQYVGYGSSTDLWGLSWASSDINSSGFGAVASVNVPGSTSTLQVDYVRITVYYTAAFDPTTTAPAFYRSETQPPPLPPANQSQMFAGLLELTLVTQPTRAFFVLGQSAPPPPVIAPGARTFRPEQHPPDELPPLGWKMEPCPPAARQAVALAQSWFTIPWERTPPDPDAWLTVNRPVVQPQPTTQPRTFFAMPTVRFPPNPDAWLTVNRPPVWPVPPPVRSGQFNVLKPFDFPIRPVLSQPSSIPWIGRSGSFAIQPPPIPLPLTVFGRSSPALGRGSSLFAFPQEMSLTGELDAARFLRGQSIGPPAMAGRSWFFDMPDPTSTGILTLGFLQPLVARPIVLPGWPEGNETRIAWTPQTLSILNEDNRNAVGKNAVNISGTGLPRRDQTGTGTT